MLERSSGVIEPRVAMSVEAADRVGHEAGLQGGDLQLGPVFEEVFITSRIVTASASGLSGAGVQARDGVGVGRPADDAEDEPADRRQLGIVEGLGDVARRVIERVLARC